MSYGHRSLFGDDDPGSHIGQLSCVFDWQLTAYGQRKRRDDRVAGTGYVKNLSRH